VVALTLDASVSQQWLAEFYRGMAATARRYRVAIVGGDVAQADGVLAASLTLLGESTGRVLTRSGARLGDFIYVTGRLGLSVETGHHFRFTPRLKEGTWLARQPEVQAMIDVSDGLAKDLRAITPRDAAPAIDAESVPRRPGATVKIALTEGEDYELLFAVSRRADQETFARKWHHAFPRVPLTCLGRFVRAGQQPAGTVDLAGYHGYEHLR
jgi:thiamine-monophosphate kinase